jgi:hypothetical protein
LKNISKFLRRDDTRCPTPNPQVPETFLLYMLLEFDVIRMMLEIHSGNIRALDRKRLNSVGIK